jgi:tRNA pseudouridine55 synthase
MDGLLLIDKPPGPTSHDVVARVRRTSGERRIGHTGTLDPRASGLLPLVMGHATRLAAFLAGGDKTYDATIRLGVSTDTDDADGRLIGEPVTAWPSLEMVEAALAPFRGTWEQLPPRHSAKKVAGERAYTLARRDEPVELKPVRVTVHALTLRRCEGDLLEIRLVTSAGFYVRALARDLGRSLGCGAHLWALRRTHSGPFDVLSACPLGEAEQLGERIAARVIPPGEALPHLPQVTLTDAGAIRVAHGNPIGPDAVVGRFLPASADALHVRLRAPDGRLLAVASLRGGALHPVVVLNPGKPLT